MSVCWLGLLLVISFDALALPFANMKCAAAPSGNGVVCNANSVSDAATGFRYSQAFVILIPDGVLQPSRVLLHLHGYRGVCGDDSTARFIDKFGLLGLMPRLRALNAIGVFPRSLGKETTYTNELIPRFSLFTKWIYRELQQPSISWMISGHSGAYIPIGSMLAQQTKLKLNLDGIVLLDATYSHKSSYFAQWEDAARTNPQMAVYSVTRPNTSPGTQLLAKTLKKYGLSVLEQTDLSPHCGIPKKDLGPILDNYLARSQRALTGRL